jgi:polyhydroxybutyrate depolymerase
MFHFTRGSPLLAWLAVGRLGKYSSKVILTMTLAAALAAYAAYGFWPPKPLAVSETEVIPGPPNPICRSMPPVGDSAAPHEIKSPDGLRIMVRTPLNYNNDRRFPLIVVFPPAGLNRRESEQFYHLTPEATRDGMVLAYSDHIPMSRRAVEIQARVAEAVAGRFCVDESRIVYFGHSDGGAMAEGVTAMISEAMRPKTIIASGAGITGEDLTGLGCSTAANAMIIHNNRDKLFPDFGRGAANYWAKCAGCRPLDLSGNANVCQFFEGCRSNIRVAYCEVGAPHTQWPEINTAALSFIMSADSENKTLP